VARREAWRNKKRSALVVVMLALPVAGASAADTLWRSSQITAEQKDAWEMGGYDALVTDVGGPVYQTPDLSSSGPVRDAANGNPSPTSQGQGQSPGESASATATNNSGPTAPRTAADLTALLPAGSRVAAAQAMGGEEVQIADGAGRTWAQTSDTDLADPLLAGTANRVRGAAPTAADQVALSSTLAAALHKGVGDTIAVRATGPAPGGAAQGMKTLHVTGVYDSKLRPYDSIVFLRPAALGTQPSGQLHIFPIAVPGGVDWNLTLQLNAHGFTVQSKRLLADPPPRSQVPYYRAYPGGGVADENQQATEAVAAIALSVVVLEVVLLAGPAFAVSARRRRRDFGLFGAAGADGRRLRRIVLADGVVLGAAGGVIGAVAGILVSAATLPWFGHVTQQSMGGYRLKPLELLAAAGLGVGTGVVAALAPAISTARQHVLVALTGRRGQSATPWKLPLTGLAGMLIGSALIIGGAWHGGSSVVIVVVAGIALAELGLVAFTPLLVAWSGKLGRLLPLTGRLALRDGARNRGRSAPAVAAIMAAVAGATAVAMYITSDDAQQRRYYHSQLRLGQAVAPLTDGYDAGGLAPDAVGRLAAQITSVLPTRQSAVLQGMDFGRSQGPISTVDVKRTPGNTCPPDLQSGQALGSDPRCGGIRGGQVQFLTGSSSIVAGGPDLLRILLGRTDQNAEAVLQSGGAVVFDKYDLADAGPHPTVDLQVTKYCQQQQCAQTQTDAVYPAAFVDSPRSDVTVVVAPGTLDKDGVTFTPFSLLIDTTRMPTAQEEKRADDLVSEAGIQTAFQVERGYQSQTWVGVLALAVVAAVVMLGAAAVATGLAITDAQADLETLAAVGARPRVRRLLAGSQAAVTAGMGAILGAAFGLLPAVGLIEAGSQQIASVPGNTLAAEQTQFAVPWLYLGIVVVALPVLAAAGAATFTRSRIEMRRRRA
jgi:putative ABC transport system permease protein